MNTKIGIFGRALAALAFLAGAQAFAQTLGDARESGIRHMMGGAADAAFQRGAGKPQGFKC